MPIVSNNSLVDLIGLSPSHLVSAAADATLRIWSPDTGEVQHVLDARTCAVTCFQHDELEILSWLDGTLKMWDDRLRTIVREFLSNLRGIWLDSRWCVAASDRSDATYPDVWDFSNARGELDGGWIGEPAGGIYDEDMTGDEEEVVEVGRRAVDQGRDNPPPGTDMENVAGSLGGPMSLRRLPTKLVPSLSLDSCGVIKAPRHPASMRE